MHTDCKTAASAIRELNGFVVGKRYLKVQSTLSGYVSDFPTSPVNVEKSGRDRDEERSRHESDSEKWEAEYYGEDRRYYKELRRREREREQLELECYGENWGHTIEETGRLCHEESQQLAQKREQERGESNHGNRGHELNYERYGKRESDYNEARRYGSYERESANYLVYTNVADFLGTMRPGATLPPEESALNHISKTLASMSKASLLDILIHMKVCFSSNYSLLLSISCCILGTCFQLP